MGIVLAGLVGVVLVAHWLSTQPQLPINLRASPEGLVKLGSTSVPALQRMEGQSLEGLRLEVTSPTVRSSPAVRRSNNSFCNAAHAGSPAPRIVTLTWPPTGACTT